MKIKLTGQVKEKELKEFCCVDCGKNVNGISFEEHSKTEEHKINVDIQCLIRAYPKASKSLIKVVKDGARRDLIEKVNVIVKDVFYSEETERIIPFALTAWDDRLRIYKELLKRLEKELKP